MGRGYHVLMVDESHQSCSIPTLTRTTFTCKNKLLKTSRLRLLLVISIHTVWWKLRSSRTFPDKIGVSELLLGILYPY